MIIFAIRLRFRFGIIGGNYVILHKIIELVLKLKYYNLVSTKVAKITKSNRKYYINHIRK